MESSDSSRAVGIGGIMGGAETEISFSTKNVLIECAWFEPIAIRRAARFLKLHTEASTRFGRGADPEMAAEKTSRDACGNSPRHGCGRPGQRGGSQPQRAGICARSNRSKSRRGRLAACRLGMHAAFLACGSGARN